jgi:hypothetical protein
LTNFHFNHFFLVENRLAANSIVEPAQTSAQLAVNLATLALPLTLILGLFPTEKAPQISKGALPFQSDW